MTYRTEAQDIVEKLRAAGMSGADIAHQIGVSAQTVKDIIRSKNSGNFHVAKLRGLLIHLGGAGALAGSPQSSTGKPTGNPPDGATSSVPPNATPYPPSEPVAPKVALEVDDAPRDERSTAARLRDSIKEAMLGGGATATVTAPRARGGGSGRAGSVTEAQADFVEQILPIVALVIVVLIESAIPEPYRVAAPTEAESGAIVRPPLRILARKLEIAGKLSDDAIDLLAFLGASAEYGWRMYKTVQAIRQERSQYVDADSGAGAAGAVDAGRNGASGTGAPAVRNGSTGGGATRLAAALGLVGNAGAAPEPGHRNGSGQSDADARRGAAAIERLLTADAIGSKRLGVL